MAIEIPFKRPYETIWGVEDDRNGKTVTIYSTWDMSHPECPVKLVNRKEEEIIPKLKKDEKCK